MSVRATKRLRKSEIVVVGGVTVCVVVHRLYCSMVSVTSITRAQLLSRSAKGGAVLVFAGAVAGSFAGQAKARRLRRNSSAIRSRARSASPVRNARAARQLPERGVAADVSALVRPLERRINHAKGQYVVGAIHTNTIEVIAHPPSGEV